MNIKSVPLFYCLIFLYVFTGVKTESSYVCESTLYDIDIENTQITNIQEHCKDKNCLPKCCKRNEILINRNTSMPTCGDPKSYNLTIKYDELIPIYKSQETEGNVTQIKTKKLFSEYPLVINKLTDKTCGEWMMGKIKFNIQENGDAMYDYTFYIGSWIKRDPAHYCVDIIYDKGKTIATTLLSKEKAPENEDTIKYYGAAMSLISSIFLVLTFGVYCVLPQLRSMPGMLQMAYVAALFVTFVTRGCMSLIWGGFTFCIVSSSLFYFGFLSSFFWLTTMSFDIWWTFRAQRYRRPIHRQGVLTKFGWYCLGGYGFPLLMTIACILIDYNQASLPPTMARPGFERCLTGYSVLYYIVPPIGIMTGINILLFAMTLYNIWLINKEIDKIGSNTRNNNRFMIFIKLSLMMGTSWLLEFIPKFFDERSIPTWFNILISFYNLLMGLIIFITFICNKTTLRMLCIRFGIKCRWLTQELTVNPSSRSTATKSSVHNGSYHQTRSTADSDLEMEDIHEVCTSPVTETKL